MLDLYTQLPLSTVNPVAAMALLSTIVLNVVTLQYFAMKIVKVHRQIDDHESKLSKG